MHDDRTARADPTAVRVALWRAMHVQVDAPPHVLEDEIGLQLAGPDEGWRRRPDMDPKGTSPFRASIVARARFVEDLVVEQVGRGIGQYVLLGAGLDTFAQRRPEIASGLRVFEIDRPGPQAWKRQRLMDLGFPIPEWLRFVPVDFEAGSWRKPLAAAGFEVEDRRYHAHCTLGRPRRGWSDAASAAWAASANGRQEVVGFTASRLVLFESRPAPGGAVYTERSSLQFATS